MNRYIGICWFNHYNSWFTKKSLIISLLFFWLLAITSALVVRIYSTVEFEIAWLYNYENSKSGKIAEKIFNVLGGISVFLLIFVYSCLFFHHRFLISKLQLNDQQVQQQKRERLLLFQAVIVTLVLLLYFIGFLLANEILEQNLARAVYSFVSLLNSGLPPFLYFIFNSELRKCIKKNATKIFSHHNP